ncbi:acyl-CoA dehydrogenase family protein [Actinophytocola sp. NPDC049390]|uniref:acyl-CoA dehydrogenase family protein n=1 Tax=Actinophytocola sp. NPDC049390 TaxID=3363894 RepID=UPI0037A0F09C
MDFGLTDEQVAMGVAVRGWLAAHLGTARVHAYVDETSAAVDTELHHAAADLGWLGVTAPVTDGGLGLGLLDLAVVVEALGAALAPAGVWAAIAACDVLATSADAEQRRRWLAPMIAGDLVGATALRAPGGSWDSAGVAVTATADDLLTGDAGVVEHATRADVLLVAALSATGVRIFVVDARHPGVSMRAVEPVDRTTHAARVTLTGVTGDAVRWPQDGVFERVVGRLTLLVAADLIGAADSAMRITLAHLRQRRQFGRAIGGFQAIQHELAELYVELTTITDAVRYTAHSHDTGNADAALMTSVVKSRAADLAFRMAAATVQFHGALGFTWEHSAHLFFKRLHRDAYAFGDAGWHDPVIAAAAVGAETTYTGGTR